MSRKDYRVIAKALIEAYHQSIALRVHGDAFNALIASFNQTLAKHYDNFNDEKFYTYILKGIKDETTQPQRIL